MLQFKPRHKNNPEWIDQWYAVGYQAKHTFQNGYTVSVLNGWGYSDLDQLYEMAIMVGDDIVYDAGLTPDVFPWKTREEIDELMQKVKQLPPR